MEILIKMHPTLRLFGVKYFRGGMLSTKLDLLCGQLISLNSVVKVTSHVLRVRSKCHVLSFFNMPSFVLVLQVFVLLLAYTFSSRPTQTTPHD